VKNKLRITSIGGLAFAVLAAILAVVLIARAARFTWDARSFSSPAETLSDFTYKIAGGASGTASFPHSFSNCWKPGLRAKSLVIGYTLKVM
jgi:hypothetical protein